MYVHCGYLSTHVHTYVVHFSCPAGEKSYKQYQEFGDLEYKDFRVEAQQHADLRHEAFQKAAKAWKSKQKDLASYYAQQVSVRELRGYGWGWWDESGWA